MLKWCVFKRIEHVWTKFSGVTGPHVRDKRWQGATGIADMEPWVRPLEKLLAVDEIKHKLLAFKVFKGPTLHHLVYLYGNVYKKYYNALYWPLSIISLINSWHLVAGPQSPVYTHSQEGHVCNHVNTSSDDKNNRIMLHLFYNFIEIILEIIKYMFHNRNTGYYCAYWIKIIQKWINGCCCKLKDEFLSSLFCKYGIFSTYFIRNYIFYKSVKKRQKYWVFLF